MITALLSIGEGTEGGALIELDRRKVPKTAPLSGDSAVDGRRTEH